MRSRHRRRQKHLGHIPIRCSAITWRTEFAKQELLQSQQPAEEFNSFLCVTSCTLKLLISPHMLQEQGILVDAGKCTARQCTAPPSPHENVHTTMDAGSWTNTRMCRYGNSHPLQPTSTYKNRLMKLNLLLASYGAQIILHSNNVLTITAIKINLDNEQSLMCNALHMLFN